MAWTKVVLLAAMVWVGITVVEGARIAGRDGQQGDPHATVAVERAGRALQALQAALITRLGQAMAQGGPRQAIGVCRKEAQAISKKVADEQGFAIGRTSHRLRNPVNAPPEWARALVEAAAGRKAAAVEPQMVDLGDRIGVLRPIGTAEMCTRCHGAADAVTREIGDLLSASYPSDQAVGFAVGDLRGWGWAEVPKAERPR